MQVNESGVKKKLSFLDMLLAYQEEHDFTDDEIQEEVNTFLFGVSFFCVSSLVKYINTFLFLSGTRYHSFCPDLRFLGVGKLPGNCGK